VRVIVAGAGVGGLTAALALRAAGVEVSVFEQMQSAGATMVGGGFHLWPNAIRALRELGLDESARQRGAPIKRGVCLISYRTGVPVLPCVMLGSNALNHATPWLPFRRARLWIAFGDHVIEPRRDLERKAARQMMARQLQDQFEKLCQELINSTDVDESSVP